MPRGLVALLAKEGLANLQHRRVIGAVRIVTMGAIILRRAMLPKERAAELCMTGVAGFIDRVLLERGSL